MRPKKKRIRLGEYQIINEAVYTWFKDASIKKNLLVSGFRLQEFSETIKIKKFEAIFLWVFCLRKRYGISGNKFMEKRKVMLCQLHMNGKNYLLKYYRNIHQRISTMLMKLLFYHLLPNFSMTLKCKKKVKCRENSKARILFLFSCNVTDTELLVSHREIY